MSLIRQAAPLVSLSGIDWTSPYSRKLQRAVLGQAGSDVVHGGIATRDTGWTYANTKYGRALSFDGTNDGLSFAEPVPTTGLTVYARVFSTASGTVDRTIFAMGASTPSGAYSIQMRRETAAKMIAYAFAAGVDQSTGSGDNTFTDNTWIDYCLVWNGSDIILYRDGKGLGAASVGGTITSLRATAVFTVGENNFGAKAGWLGHIAFCHYWKNRAFSSAEVMEYYNNPYQIYRCGKPSRIFATAGGAAAGKPLHYYAQQRRLA